MSNATPSADSSGAEQNAERVSPRAALAQLPAYAAGKPAVEVPGLVAYKLASNENPYGPVPAVRQALHDFDLFNRYPDPSATVLC